MMRPAAVLLVLVLLLAGPVAGAESIRVGYLGPLTGIFAAAGKDMLDGLKLAFGSPDTVARHIETMRAMGIGQVLCWMNFGGLPQEKIRRSMELFAREVMPRFR